MNLLDIFTGGPTPAKWRELGAFLRANRIIGGVGVKVVRDPVMGTVISASPRRAEAIVRSIIPLAILASRPPYIPAPVSPPATGYQRHYIEWGTVNDVEADNWDDYHDINATTYFFAKATFAVSDEMKIASWEIVTGAAIDTHETPAWAIGDPRPDYIVILLGQVLFSGGSGTIIPSAGGSILVTEHLTEITPNGTSGAVHLGKQISHHRLPYA